MFPALAQSLFLCSLLLPFVPHGVFRKSLRLFPHSSSSCNRSSSTLILPLSHTRPSSGCQDYPCFDVPSFFFFSVSFLCVSSVSTEKEVLGKTKRRIAKSKGKKQNRPGTFFSPLLVVCEPWLQLVVRQRVSHSHRDLFLAQHIRRIPSASLVPGCMFRSCATYTSRRVVQSSVNLSVPGHHFHRKRSGRASSFSLFPG